MLSGMRPFSPHLRLHRDRRDPNRLILRSDVLLRVHARVLAAGAALVVLGHGAGQLLAPLGGAVQVAAPLIALILAVGAWLALPSLVVTTHLSRDLVELRRARRRTPVARLLREEILAVRLSAMPQGAAAAPWRLGDRQVELVTAEGHETMAIAGARDARALAKGLSTAMDAPLRDDTPEAEAEFCLQQALLSMGSLDDAAEPPEGLRLRAGLEKGWLILELPGRGPGRATLALLMLSGGLLLFAPPLLALMPAYEDSLGVALGLSLAAACWLACIVVTVLRSHRPTALAASPLGVRISRGRLFGAESITLPPPVSARREGARLTLTSGARIVVESSTVTRDLAWAAEAINSLAGRPLVPERPVLHRAPNSTTPRDAES